MKIFRRRGLHRWNPIRGSWMNLPFHVGRLLREVPHPSLMPCVFTGVGSGNPAPDSKWEVAGARDVFLGAQYHVNSQTHAA